MVSHQAVGVYLITHWLLRFREQMKIISAVIVTFKYLLTVYPALNDVVCVGSAYGPC
jgi:hypothetical protein